MLAFIIRRLLGLVVVLFTITVVVFLLFFATPGVDPSARLAGRNAEHLVRIAVIMMIIEDAISPAVVPAIRREFCFKILREMLRLGQSQPINDERKTGVVRNAAVIGKAAQLG